MSALDLCCVFRSNLECVIKASLHGTFLSWNSERLPGSWAASFGFYFVSFLAQLMQCVGNGKVNLCRYSFLLSAPECLHLRK